MTIMIIMLIMIIIVVIVAIVIMSSHVGPGGGQGRSLRRGRRPG